MVGLSTTVPHSVPHTESLEVSQKQYGEFLHKEVPTEAIIRMAGFVLKNNFLSLLNLVLSGYLDGK